MSVAPSEFVPLELTVEPDVSDDPKCEDQISGRLFYRDDRLEKTPDMMNPLLSLRGAYSFQEYLRGRSGFFNEA